MVRIASFPFFGPFTPVLSFSSPLTTLFQRAVFALCFPAALRDRSIHTSSPDAATSVARQNLWGVRAQEPSFETWSGPGDDSIYMARSDEDGGILTVGTIIDPVNKSDIQLARYLNGISWVVQWGGIDAEVAYELSVLSNQTFAIAGYTNATGGAGDDDALLAFFNIVNGVFINATLMGGSTTDRAYGLAKSAPNILFMVGETRSYTQGARDLFLSKFVNGALVWTITAGESSDDSGSQVAVNSLGDAVISGVSNKEEGAGHYDALVLRVDTNSNVIWKKHVGSSSYEDIRNMALTPANDAVITGLSSSFGVQGYSAWLAILDSNGARKLAIVLDGSGDDGGLAIYIHPEGYFWGGHFANHAFLASLQTQNLAVNWVKSIAGLGNEGMAAITSLSNNSIVALGPTTSFGDNDVMILDLPLSGEFVNCSYLKPITPLIIDVTSYLFVVNAEEIERRVWNTPSSFSWTNAFWQPVTPIVSEHCIIEPTTTGTTGNITTGVPTTGIATTGIATTGVATTGNPTTGLATTGIATTGVATTGVPTTGIPTTGVATTGVPTTGVATTGIATTGNPATGIPTTGIPTTGIATTGVPTTGIATTGNPTTGPSSKSSISESSPTPDPFDPLPIILTFTLGGAAVIAGGLGFAMYKRWLPLPQRLSTRTDAQVDVEMNAASHTYQNAPTTAVTNNPYGQVVTPTPPSPSDTSKKSEDHQYENLPPQQASELSHSTDLKKVVPKRKSVDHSAEHPYQNVKVPERVRRDSKLDALIPGPDSERIPPQQNHLPIPSVVRRGTTPIPPVEENRVPKSVRPLSMQVHIENKGPSTPYDKF